MRTRSCLLLAASLVAGEAVYLVASLALPWWRYGTRLDSWRRILTQRLAQASSADATAFAVCLTGIAVLAAAYGLGWVAIRQHAAPRWLVWVGAISFAATLYWLLPITADLFVYLSQAHLFTDLGVNPFVQAPSDQIADRLLAAYRIVYTQRPSVYGPGWVLLSAPGTLGRHDVVSGILYLKGLAAGAYLGCAWLLERILRRVRPESALEGLYLFAWNPLVLLMAVGDGHNDIVMMAAVLLAMLWLLKGRWALAAAALTLSVWIKYTSLILVPFCIIYAVRAAAAGPQSNRAEDRTSRADAGLRGPGWPLAQGGLAALLVTVGVLVPFGWPDWLIGEAGRLLRPANWRSGEGGLPAAALALGILAFLIVYALLLWRALRSAARFENLADMASAVALLALVLGAARGQPWHLIWPASLAGLSLRRWMWPLVVCLSVILLGVQVWVEWGAPGLGKYS